MFPVASHKKVLEAAYQLSSTFLCEATGIRVTTNLKYLLKKKEFI